MSPEVRSVIIGMSGFFSAGFTSAVVPGPLWAKVVIACVVALLTSTLVWAFLRPKNSP